MANRYNCLLITPEGTKDITIFADTVHPDSTCATRFQRKIRIIGDYGSPEFSFQLVAQYPTEKLVIESIDYNVKENEL
jgi:hypothetical protein